MVALVFNLLAPRAQAHADEPILNFKGRLLVIASDGDMQAQAYAGQVLGTPTPDTLSVVKLDGKGLPIVVGSIAVPNSVIGPPDSVAVSPDGRYAIVIETRGSHPANRPKALLKDLPPGRAITVVDLRKPDQPSIVQQISGRSNPISIAIRADGIVAIAYDTAATHGPPLDLYTFRNGRLKQIKVPSIPGFTNNDRLKDAAFAPGGTFVLVYATKPRLSMMHLSHAGQPLKLTRSGNDVPLVGVPFEVRFTPNGRFALVNDMNVPEKGDDVRGTITSISLNSSRTSNGEFTHSVVSKARTGVLPEGLVVSPDGQYVATTNLERTAYGPRDPHQGFFASVTLLHINSRNGQLSRVGDYPFAGVIPEAAAFDNSSRFLAVLSFDHISPQASRGSVDFWRIARDFQDPARTELAPTGYTLTIARGAQSMEIVR